MSSRSATCSGCCSRTSGVARSPAKRRMDGRQSRWRPDFSPTSSSSTSACRFWMACTRSLRFSRAAPHTKVIVYSSEDPVREREAIELGAFRYLKKGTDPTLVVGCSAGGAGVSALREDDEIAASPSPHRQSIHSVTSSDVAAIAMPMVFERRKTGARARVRRRALSAFVFQERRRPGTDAAERRRIGVRRAPSSSRTAPSAHRTSGSRVAPHRRKDDMPRWLWIVIIIILVLVVAGYFMRGRRGPV